MREIAGGACSTVDANATEGTGKGPGVGFKDRLGATTNRVMC